ncbi:hypothetical protein [Pendulispora albinea]|uniref:DUF1444 family protein n=1 Tax=Pendulispora albinea TaxID=2741071 RepID=A0ABZ2LWH5_9BACT
MGKRQATEIFEEELSKRNMAFTILEPELYEIRVHGGTYTVSLQNVAREYEREGDPACIVHFVEQALRQSELPAWEDAGPRLYWSAEPSDQDFGETLREEITPTVSRVLVLADPHEERIRWLTQRELATWGVDIADLRAAAGQNLDRLLVGKKPEVSLVDGHQLGMIPVESVFKASLVFAPGFKDFVEADIGWPVLAVIPCRDFIYVIAESDKAFLGRLGGVVQREFRESGYPITTEVLRIADDGIRAIGAFPR